MIDISLLLSNVSSNVDFDEEIEFDETYIKNTEIIDISKIKVTGTITKDSINQLYLNFSAKGYMNLPCAITLEPVKTPIDLAFNVIIDEKDENNLKKDENTLELKDFLWENIVVEIPLRVVSENAYDKEYKGNGWKLITDEDKKAINNKSFEVLKQLLDKEEEES